MSIAVRHQSAWAGGVVPAVFHSSNPNFSPTQFRTTDLPLRMDELQILWNASCFRDEGKQGASALLGVAGAHCFSGKGPSPSLPPMTQRQAHYSSSPEWGPEFCLRETGRWKPTLLMRPLPWPAFRYKVLVFDGNSSNSVKCSKKQLNCEGKAKGTTQHEQWSPLLLQLHHKPSFCLRTSPWIDYLLILLPIMFLLGH